MSSFGCGSYSGDFFEAGAHTLTYTAWDAAGNFDTSCSFTITVETTSPPVFIYCPGDTVIYTKVDTCGAGFVSNAVVYSDCGANIICNIEPTELLPVGSTTVFHIAEDISGRQDSCSFNVTVVDNVAPEFENCPDTISVFDSVASWSAIQAADNCAVDTLFSTHQSGDSFPFGHTTVIYTTIDWAGNTSTCEFVVSVGVNAPLMIDTIIVSNATLIGGNDGTIDIEVSGGVAPYNCLWSTGDTTEDLSNIPAGSYYVTVWDAGGNTVSATAVVQEPDCPQPTGVTKSATDGEITINWSSSPGALTTQIQSRVKPGQNGAMADNRNSFSPAGALTKTFPYNTANCGYTYQARVRHICSADNSLKSPWKLSLIHI